MQHVESTKTTFEHFGAFSDWLVSQPIPTEDSRSGGKSRLTDGYRLRAKFLDWTKVELRDSVLYWRSNDAPIPPHVFEDAYLPVPAVQRERYDAVVTESLRRYRENPPECTEEQLAELRSVHGEGAVVVDALLQLTILR